MIINYYIVVTILGFFLLSVVRLSTTKQSNSLIIKYIESKFSRSCFLQCSSSRQATVAEKVEAFPVTFNTTNLLMK